MSKEQRRELVKSLNDEEFEFCEKFALRWIQRWREPDSNLFEYGDSYDVFNEDGFTNYLEQVIFFYRSNKAYELDKLEEFTTFRTEYPKIIEKLEGKQDLGWLIDFLSYNPSYFFFLRNRSITIELFDKLEKIKKNYATIRSSKLKENLDGIELFKKSHPDGGYFRLKTHEESFFLQRSFFDRFFTSCRYKHFFYDKFNSLIKHNSFLLDLSVFKIRD